MSDDMNVADKTVYFLLGAAIGAAAALLLAPRSGAETRKLIVTKAREGADAVSSRTKAAAGKALDYVEQGKEILQQQREQLAAAFEAGKQAYQEEKEKA